MKALELKGQKFGSLTVIKREGKTAAGKLKWLCKCDCGNEKAVISSRLKNGHTRSCGCAQVESVRSRSTTHGCSRNRSENPEYNAWVCMLRRTTVEKVERFKHYGGKGISVCDRWCHSFENFLADMGRKPTAEHSIDRIDNDLGYFPANCRWSTRKEQMRNTSRNRRVTYKGVTKSLSEWSEIRGIGYYTLFSRLYKGRKWTIEEAFETPIKGGKS